MKGFVSLLFFSVGCSVMGRGMRQLCQVNNKKLPEVNIIENNNDFTRVIRLREEPIPFCILKVVTPRGQTIRFNITGRSLPWPEDNIIHGHIPETEDTTVQLLVHKSNVKAPTLISKGSLKSGVYLIQQFRMYALYISGKRETLLKPICKKSDNIITGKVEALGSFQHCMDYNKYKNKEQTEYMTFAENPINITSYDENFENYLSYCTTSGIEGYTVIECTVTIDPNKYSMWYQTEYQREKLREPWVIKFEPTCPRPNIGLIGLIIALLVVLIILIFVCYGYYKWTRTTIGKDVLLLIGGKTDSKIMKTIEAFPNGFKGLSDLPEPLFNCTAALVNGHILVVGGKNSEGTNSEFCYKIKCSRANSQHIWKKVDKLLPKPMLGVHCMGSAVVKKDGHERMYIVKGKNVYFTKNGEEWQEVKDLPYGISLPYLASDGDNVFVSGPRVQTDFSYDAYVLSKDGNCWNPLPKLLLNTDTGVSGSGVVNIGGKKVWLLVQGSQALKLELPYRTGDKQEWIKMKRPDLKNGPSVGMCGGKITVAGGRNGGKSTKDVQTFNISEGIWENSNKPLRIPRWCHATVQIPSLTLSQKIKYFFKSIPGEFRCKSKTNELEQDPESQSFISQP